MVSKVDEYGVKNYNSGFLLLLALVAVAVVSILGGAALLHFESQVSTANITNYGDAVWVMIMSASTIGFGDFYPVTICGRILVGTMFLFGIGTMGFAGAQIANIFLGFSDTNVKNRELRKQLEEVLREASDQRERDNAIIQEAIDQRDRDNKIIALLEEIKR